MHLMELSLTSRIADYKVYFTYNSDFLKKYAEAPNTVFVVDNNVWQQHNSGMLQELREKDVILLETNEDMKTLDSVLGLYDRIMEKSPKRNMTMVSIGGGITQDVTGFTASTLYRGINWVFVPTTLLAQADSCIGSKTSINYKKYKNLIGTFFPPHEIYINTKFVDSLAELDYFSGLGEVAKLHLMGGQDTTIKFIEKMPLYLQRDDSALLEAIQTSLLIKQTYIESDEFDTGKRNMLNFGHCFGHAIESATQFAIPHGQAVVLGMLLANEAALIKGLLSEENYEFINNEVLLPVFKINVKDITLPVEEIIKAMGQDKKRIGQHLALVMISNGYEMIKQNELTPQEAADVLDRALKSLS